MKMIASSNPIPARVGFLSTRFAGTDGVTLESAKWAHVLEARGASCFWMAGQLDKPPEISHLEPLAFFNHPEIIAIQAELFGSASRSRAVTNRVHEIKEQLKDSIYQFLEQFSIDLLVPQNVLAIPMHIPLGLAVTEVMAESGVPTIAHHHDFTWERERFTINAASDYLATAFPPTLPAAQHVVINSLQQKELARRFGLASTVIPNVIDFDTPPPGIDDYNRDFRQEIGIHPDDILVLQPTRLVARKGIEHTIELLRRLKLPNLKLVLSHPAGDEGDDYLALLNERISEAVINCLPIWDRIAEKRTLDANGRKVFTLFDVYPHADLVTYPSHYEGFGNAFLEAIYFGKPVFVNTYAVFSRDIEPLGFKTISMSQLVTNEVIEKTRKILTNPQLRAEWAATNFTLGQKFFSHRVLKRKLEGRIASLFGEQKTHSTSSL